MADAFNIRSTYSSQIFNDYQMPIETKALEELFRNRKFIDYCTYFMTLDPLSAQVRKLAKLAITEFSFEGDENINKLYQETFQKLGMHAGGHMLDEIGMELLGYGSSMVSMYYPFRRLFVCSSCKKAMNIDDVVKDHKVIKDYKVHKRGIEGSCPLCKKRSLLVVRDTKTTSKDRCKLTRWSLKDMDIKYIKPTGDRIFIYRPGASEKKYIKDERDRDHWAVVPWEIIRAVHDNEAELRIYPDALFHLRGPSINGLDSPWGLPIILPALLLAMHMQMLRKANDVAAHDRSMAHTFISPRPVPGEGHPAARINLEKWSSFTATEVAMHRMDPARRSYMPFPLEITNVGGDAKVLMLYPEIRQVQEDIAVALGLPAEFVFGGGNYASGVVSHRFVHMFLQTLQLEYEALANWVIDNLVREYGFPRTKASMRPPKMADDVQMYQLYMALLQGGYMGPEVFYRKTGIEDWKEVKEDIERNSTFIAGQMKKQMLAQLDTSALQMTLQQKMQPQPPQVPPPQGTGKPTMYPDAISQEFMSMGVDAQTLQQAQRQGVSPDQLRYYMQLQQQIQVPPAGVDGGSHPIQYPPEITQQLIQMGIPQDQIDAAQLQGMPPDALVQQMQEQAGQQGQQQQQGQEGQPTQVPPPSAPQGQYPLEFVQYLLSVGVPEEVVAEAQAKGVPPELLLQQVQKQMQQMFPAQQPMAQVPPQGQQPSSQQPPQQPAIPGMPSGEELKGMVSRMITMPPEQLQVYMENMKNQNPMLHSVLSDFMQQMPASAAVPGGGGSAVDMRPLPEQRPPRRPGA